MEQQSDSTARTTQNGATPARRWRWKAFPLVWILGYLALATAIWYMDIDRGIKPVFIGGMGALVIVGLLVWFLVASPFRRWMRWGITLAIVALLWGCTQAVDVINDGDLRPVGVRLIWQPLPDQLLDVPQAEQAADDWATTPRDYLRFLGNGYWAEVAGVRLDPDWQAHPPEEMWRREIGAGWSSFAIVGDYAVTQEQRGDRELVVCYRLSTGDIVWSHADEARFDPATVAGGFGGLGPRATPTVVGERVITQGATGIVNCLDAHTANVIWSHDAHQEQGADDLIWGKSGSPLIVDDMVVISVGAPASAAKRESYNSSLVAYDLETGEIRWTAGNRITSYASPVLATFAGERQILQINENYLTAHRASDGEVLWEHDWPGSSSADASCSQPVPLEGDRLFLSRNYTNGGASLLKVGSDDGENWQATPAWQPPVKRVLKTKFSNVVVRDGHVYGLDGILLQCIELETGRSVWKHRRQPAFGHGQIMLIGGHILILSEIGELVLVECTPNDYQEVAAVQVLDEGDVTWNNPAFSAPYLLVRNGREAACYRLPLVE